MKVWRIIVAIVAGVLMGTGSASAAPAMSGDIAFTKSVQGREDIWLFDVESKRQWRVTHSGAHTPVWSPDGRNIAFVTDDGRLGVMRANGSGKRYLTDRAAFKDSSPAWSVDGSHIAFVRHTKDGSRSALFVVRSHGSHEVNLSGWASSGGYRSPSWSPDSRHIVYEQYSPGSPTKLLIVDSQNNTRRELVVTSDEIEARPKWSPSGKKILFNDSANEVYTIWPDGSHRTVISDGDSYNAVWSPEGTRIAFTEDDNSMSISGPDGTVSFAVLSGTFQHVRDLAWLSDGGSVMFLANTSGGAHAPSGIFLVDSEDIHSGNVTPRTLLRGQHDPIRQLAPKP